MTGCHDNQHGGGCSNGNKELNEVDKTDYCSDGVDSENSDIEIAEEGSDDEYDPKDDNYDLSFSIMNNGGNVDNEFCNNTIK